MLGAVALLMLDWMLNKDRELVSYKPLAILLEEFGPYPCVVVGEI